MDFKADIYTGQEGQGERIDLLLEQLARTLAALHRAGLPVSAVNRPATGRPPFAMIVLEDVNFKNGVFYRQTTHAGAEEEEE